MVGKAVCHYRILEKIGQDGMGKVFLAQDTTLDRKVALTPTTRSQRNSVVEESVWSDTT